MIAAYLGLFVGLVDANAVNLALPAIRTDLGGGISGAQWTIDAYNVAFAAVLLTSGALGDRFGRRALLRVGLMTFVPLRHSDLLADRGVTRRARTDFTRDHFTGVQADAQLQLHVGRQVTCFPLNFERSETRA